MLTAIRSLVAQCIGVPVEDELGGLSCVQRAWYCLEASHATPQSPARVCTELAFLLLGGSSSQ